MLYTRTTKHNMSMYIHVHGHAVRLDTLEQALTCTCTCMYMHVHRYVSYVQNNTDIMTIFTADVMEMWECLHKDISLILET